MIRGRCRFATTLSRATSLRSAWIPDRPFIQQARTKVGGKPQRLVVDEEYGQVPCYSDMAVPIRWLGTQAWVLDMYTHREVIDTLNTTIMEHEDLMHQIIEKTTDAG